MNLLKQAISRIFPARHPDAGELLLGLPLEASGRRIYPVYTRQGHVNSATARDEPRQIGYLEISEEKTSFTSLEGRSGWILLLAPLGLVLGLITWLVRYLRRSR